MHKCTNAGMHGQPKAPCALVHWRIRPFRVSASEGLSKRDEPGGAPFARLRVELEAEVEPKRPDGRLVAEAEPGGRPHLGEIEVGGMGEHVTKIDEPDTLEPSVNRAPQLEIEDGFGV